VLSETLDGVLFVGRFEPESFDWLAVSGIGGRDRSVKEGSGEPNSDLVFLEKGLLLENQGFESDAICSVLLEPSFSEEVVLLSEQVVW
jgi:hypothetical protein